jgi:hypothetical protein
MTLSLVGPLLDNKILILKKKSYSYTKPPVWLFPVLFPVLFVYVYTYYFTIVLLCLSIKQLFPLYMCICSLACCPPRGPLID